jgi:hypothetical protein
LGSDRDVLINGWGIAKESPCYLMDYYFIEDNSVGSLIEDSFDILLNVAV